MSYGPLEWRRPRNDRDFPSRPWLFEEGEGGYSMQHTLKTLWVGDLHVNETPPGWRTSSYRQDILAKVEWIMTRAEEEKVDVILFAGDIFHSKRKVPFGLLADFADVLALADCEKIIVPGNHDLIDNNLLDVHRRPIGLLARMPGISLGIDPIARGPLDMQFRPYVHDMPPAACRWIGSHNPKRWHLLAVHYGVTERALPYHTLVTDHPDWLSGADVVFSGHVHDDLGVWKDRHGTLIFNTGSISRGSLTEDNLERTPRVLFTEWAAKPVIPVFKAWDIPVRPAAEVFNLEEATARKEGERVAQDFLAQLGSTVVQAVSLETLKASIHEMELPAPVKGYAVTALEDAWED